MTWHRHVRNLDTGNVFAATHFKARSISGGLAVPASSCCRPQPVKACRTPVRPQCVDVLNSRVDQRDSVQPGTERLVRPPVHLGSENQRFFLASAAVCGRHLTELGGVGHSRFDQSAEEAAPPAEFSGLLGCDGGDGARTEVFSHRGCPTCMKSCDARQFPASAISRSAGSELQVLGQPVDQLPNESGYDAADYSVGEWTWFAVLGFGHLVPLWSRWVGVAGWSADFHAESLGRLGHAIAARSGWIGYRCWWRLCWDVRNPDEAGRRRCGRG